jgi:serine/threonine protein kinase
MKLPPTIDRYEVIDRLGRGGMGIVYRARDPRLGRTVAVKVLATNDEEFRQRFLQEAQLAATLHHKNIVTVFDYGEQETGPFIVMEYIEGATIADYLLRGTPLPLDRKLELLYDLAIALDYAHNHGIVHRDIKPANLMIDRDGLLKVLDFGVARLSESQLTQVGAMIGTPSYMAPEQIAGEPTDRRTDVFAVGVTAYELLSSQKAFPDQISIRAILLEDPVPLRTLCPNLDPAIDRIVRTAIRKEPSRRYATLALMATDIKRALDRQRSVPDDESTRPVATLARSRRKSDSGALQALERARNAFAEGRYESAISAAAEVLESAPDNAEALDLTRQAFGAFERSRAVTRTSDVVSDGTGGRPPAAATSAPQRRNAMPIAIGVATILLTAAAIAGIRWLKPPTRVDVTSSARQTVSPLPAAPAAGRGETAAPPTSTAASAPRTPVSPAASSMRPWRRSRMFRARTSLSAWQWSGERRCACRHSFPARV